MVLFLKRSLRKLHDGIIRGKLVIVVGIISFICTINLVLNTSTNDFETYATTNYNTERDWTFYRGCVDTHEYIQDNNYKKMNSTFVMLTRNEEIEDVLKTINSIESHFNQWFQYPYVFINNEAFTTEFKNKVESMTSAKTEFGIINEMAWDFPEDIRNSELFHQSIKDQGDRGILYGGMESYHKMCRFYSGLFYKHPLMKQYEWYWRLEPNVEFYCDISYDPFFEMARNNKKYGFTIVIPELVSTIPNLFRYTQAFIRNKKLKVGSLWKLFAVNRNILKTPNKDLSDFVNFEDDIQDKFSEQVAIDFLLTENKDNSEGVRKLVQRARSKKPIVMNKFDNQEYNNCHFWSNFEIAKLDIFDNELYDEYFRFLEKSGGFWRERWGDAPVHSLGLGLTLNVEDIHYFRDIGYRHASISHCPKNFISEDGRGQLPYKSVENRYFRTKKDSLFDKAIEEGSSCRCKCPTNDDVEDYSGICMYRWLELTHADDSDVNFGRKSGGEYKPYIDSEQVYSDYREVFNGYRHI